MNKRLKQLNRGLNARNAERRNQPPSRVVPAVNRRVNGWAVPRRLMLDLYHILFR